MKTWLILYLSSAIFSGWTSYSGLRTGCREAWIGPSAPTANIAYKSALTVGLTYGFIVLNRHHRGAGKWWVLAASGVNAIDGVHNLRTFCRP